MGDGGGGVVNPPGSDGVNKSLNISHGMFSYRYYFICLLPPPLSCTLRIISSRSTSTIYGYSSVVWFGKWVAAS